VAYYAAKHLRSGRRSTGFRKADALHPASHLNGRCKVHSVEEGVAIDRSTDEPLTLGEMLPAREDDPATQAWLSKAGRGRQLLGGSYSSDDELEADAFAVALVRNAGGDALAGERLLEALAQRVQSVGIVGDYFATHLPLVERVANLRAKKKVDPLHPRLWNANSARAAS